MNWGRCIHDEDRPDFNECADPEVAEATYDFEEQHYRCAGCDSVFSIESNGGSADGHPEHPLMPECGDCEYDRTDWAVAS